MENIIIILILVLIIGAAGLYIYRSKKNGKKCIGCPDSKTCGGNCSACKGCQGSATE
ncbi:MAG: FeoB-associated Cys-rich membrane protein [Clostridia bacterium]|nr:FeoB-associated Cys-rich membrane protein [Clostridia bacterium]